MLLNFAVRLGSAACGGVAEGTMMAWAGADSTGIDVATIGISATATVFAARGRARRECAAAWSGPLHARTAMDAKATAMETWSSSWSRIARFPNPPSFSQGFRVSGYSKAKPVNTALFAKLEPAQLGQARGRRGGQEHFGSRNSSLARCFASRPDACPRCGRCAARAAARRLADVRSVLAHSAANRQPARGRVQRR